MLWLLGLALLAWLVVQYPLLVPLAVGAWVAWTFRRPIARTLRHRSPWQRACVYAGLHEPERRSTTGELLRRARPGPDLLGETVTAAGTRLHLRMNHGWTADDVQRVSAGLATYYGARSADVTVSPENAQQVDVLLRQGDPLAHPPGAPSWAGVKRTNLWDPVPVGVDENGQVISLHLPYRTLLVGGVPGSGKTTLLHQLIAWTALDPSATLLIADGKELDFGCWRDRCAAFAEAENRELAVVLAAARYWMSLSKQRLRAAGQEKVVPGDPLCLLVLDELTAWSALKVKKSQAFQDLTHAVSRGRALGLITVVSTQRPDVEAIPGGVRDNVDLRVAFRCRTRAASDTILGGGLGDAGHDASELPDRPGIALIDNGQGPRLGRCFNLDPATVRGIAAQAQAHVIAPEPDCAPHLAEPQGLEPVPEPPAEPPEPPVFSGGDFGRWYVGTYLCSAHWLARSARERERAGDRCEQCAGNGTQHVHHRDYGGVGKGQPERDGQLVVLCAACHEVAEQERQAAKPVPPRERAEQLIRREPELGNAEVVRLLGVSLATVKRARQRVRAST